MDLYDIEDNAAKSFIRKEINNLKNKNAANLIGNTKIYSRNILNEIDTNTYLGNLILFAVKLFLKYGDKPYPFSKDIKINNNAISENSDTHVIIFTPLEIDGKDSEEASIEFRTQLKKYVKKESYDTFS